MLPQSTIKRSRKFWWVVYVGIALGTALIVQSQTAKFNLPTPLNLTTTQAEPEADPAELHMPVHIRAGVIVEMGVDYIIMESTKLKGEGKERITTLLTGETKIIEIQIPSFMNEELKVKLDQGSSIIPRVEMTPDSLYIGQRVEVLSEDDMYGYKEVSALRVEYKITVNTEEGI